MDISLNKINLEYLTNSCYMQRLSTSKKNDTYDTDINFYKKRIFNTTKHLLRGQQIDSAVNASFRNFASVCVEYFKFIDKRDIIQEDYKDHKKLETIPSKTFNIGDSNNLLLKKKNNFIDIIELMKVERVKTAVPKKIIMPKGRNFNLKHPTFKTKGLKKKDNINNKYGKRNKKTKKET